MSLRTMTLWLALIAAASFALATLLAQTAVDPETVVLYASRAVRTDTAFVVLDDPTAAGGQALRNPNLNAPRVHTPLVQPPSVAELTFPAEAGRAYHIWIRGRAEGNIYSNDSIWMQFNGSVTSTGQAIYRIGTTSAARFSLEDGTGQGNAGWMWNDNGFGILGEDLHFATTGPQTLRLQPREDGIILDQIVISPTTFFRLRPGATTNDATIYAATGVTPPPPPPPVALCGTDPTQGNLRLAWSASAGATNYRIHLGADPGQYAAPVSIGNVLQWDIPRRPDWYLAVSATNSAGASPLSTEVTTATLP